MAGSIRQHLSARASREAPLRRIFESVSIGLLLALLLTACGRPQAQALVTNEVPWQEGEVSTYAVTDLNDVYAGSAQITIMPDAREDGQQGWEIRRDLSTQGDSEILIVQVSPKGVRPNSSQLVRKDSSGEEEVTAIYDRGQVDLTLTTHRDITTYERINVPSDARDSRTLLLLARSLPLAVDYAVHINSFMPITGNLERILLWVEGQEEIEVPAGTFQTWHLILESELTDDTEAWIGVNAPYPLVKFLDGRSGGTFELNEFSAGP
jgi:hypothetical protein